MLTLDLRWSLFTLLVLLLAVGGVVAWVGHRRRGGREPLPPTDSQLQATDALRPVLEQAPFGWLILDGPRTCRYANAYARRLLDLAPPPAPLPDAPWAALLEEDREAARQEFVTAGRYRTVPLTDEQTIRWWVIPWGRRDVVFLQDTTSQKRAEEAAGHLLSELSHHLRTPLAAILTHLEVLSIPTLDDATAQLSLRLLKEEAHRMARLLQHMLDLGRLETRAEIERRPLDLLGIVEEAVAQITPQAEEKGVVLTMEVGTPLPLVVGDGDWLKQVFLDLLDNAVKFSRPGDRVTVSLHPEAERVLCAVCDTGPGIPAEHLPHLTRRFYRVAPQAVEGSGLGLALVAEVLRHHQSRLEIESHTEGEATGTCVRFTLPILPEEEVVR
ncbi:MAG TPA: hypothetical protein ENK56_06905 [Chloroflexi bacterium]|nr:hypothetical protein [Chloroflexota bacterium]